jgi:transposase-like protein
MWPAACYHVQRYANNRVEADHAQLKRRLRPTRGIKTMADGYSPRARLSRRTCAAANTRSPPTNPETLRLSVAFRELAKAI